MMGSNGNAFLLWFLLTCPDNDYGKAVFREVAEQTVLQRGNRRCDSPRRAGAAASS
jgi:hypothetical protein